MLLIIFVVRTTEEYISTNYILPVAIYPTTTDVNKPQLLDMSNNQLQKCGPVAIQLLEAAKIKSGSAEPNRKKVAVVTKAQIKEIAKEKMFDLNCFKLEAAMRLLAGHASKNE